MSESGKRATPRQARSELTVEAILDAAELVFHEHPVEAATTTMIAKRAQVSVGALYRFYDDKTAIATALTDRYAIALAGLVVEVELLLAEQGVDAIPEALGKIVDGIAAVTKKNPGYFSVMRHLRDNRIREVQIETLARWFEASPRNLDAATRRRLAGFVSEVTRALIERAPARGKARSDHLDEIKALLIPYVESHLT